MVLLIIFHFLVFQAPAAAPQAPLQHASSVQLQPASAVLQGSAYQLQ